jgi:hypothetical protein
MPRVAKRIDQQKIVRLKQMIRDQRYLDDAVDRLASRITDHLLGLPIEGSSGVYRSASSSRSSTARFRIDAE